MIKRILNEREQNILRESKLSNLSGLSKNQVDNYIENNIVDLDSAKEFLKDLSNVVRLLLRKTNLSR